MRKQLILSLLVLLVLATACKNGDSSPKSTPEPANAAAMDPPAPDTAMEAPPMDPPTPDTTMEAPSTPPPLEMPPIDLSCATDADCKFSSVPKLEGRVCCHGCPSHPASRAWVQKVVRLCDEYNGKNKAFGCPKVSCSEIPDVACLQGECQFKK